MNKKITIILFTAIISSLLLVSNYTSTQAVLGSWDVGTRETFSDYAKIVTYNKYNPEDLETTTITEILTTFDINITNVNNVTGSIDVDMIYVSSITSTSYDYFASDHILNYMTLNQLFTFNYMYDYEHNRTVLRQFNVNLGFIYFLEANWTIFNENFDSILNASTIVDTVNDPYSSTVFNITFGDFLAGCKSYTINGQSSLTAGKQQFTGTNSELTLFFDTTGYEKWRVFNGTAGYWQYYDFDIITYGDNLIYSSGGILEEFYQHRVSGQTDNLQYSESDTTIGMYHGVYTPVTTDDSSLGYLFVIPAIATIVVLVKWSRKRKN